MAQESIDYVEAFSPSKVIMFGEHAVLSGSPALAVATNLGTGCRAFLSTDGKWRVNQSVMSLRRDRYILKAVEVLGGEPLHLNTRSWIPSAAGLGSSASITVSSVASILAVRDEFNIKDCQKVAHNAECMAEDRAASPLDTSCICLGGGVIANPVEGMGEPLHVGDGQWKLASAKLPDFNIVVGFSGVKGKTREVMKGVKGFESNLSSFSKEILTDIGKVAKEGINSLIAGDLATTGEMMTRNHKLLATLGVNHPEVQKLINAVNRHSLGAKITGSGGGGCMVALTEDVEDTAAAIQRVGGVPIIASVDRRGVRVNAITL